MVFVAIVLIVIFLISVPVMFSRGAGRGLLVAMFGIIFIFGFCVAFVFPEGHPYKSLSSGIACMALSGFLIKILRTW